jgi:pimeloyl-ACP methyl ester carboxylesterase
LSDEAVLQETPAQKWRRRILKTLMRLGLVVAVYGALMLVARGLHRKILYQPPSPADAKTSAPGATPLDVQAADGVAVHALFFAGTTPKRTIVHFHGNAEVAEDNANLAKELARKGFDVVLVEYRGYGRSAGMPTNEEGIYADAEAVLAELVKRGAGPDHVVLWGQNLGGGVAAEMALRGRGSRLVLVAPFTSSADLAARVAPIFPMRWVMADRFDTLEKAPRIDMPALVVHGTADDVIPFEYGEAIAKALPHAQLVKVEGARHDNLYKDSSAFHALVAFCGG